MMYSTSGKVKVFIPGQGWSGWLSEDEGRRLENKLLYRCTPTGQKLRLVKK